MAGYSRSNRYGRATARVSTHPLHHSRPYNDYGHVILSAAKDLTRRRERSFVALRMTALISECLGSRVILYRSSKTGRSIGPYSCLTFVCLQPMVVSLSQLDYNEVVFLG